jgi:hypothetical protein
MQLVSKCCVYITCLQFIFPLYLHPEMVEVERNDVSGRKNFNSLLMNRLHSSRDRIAVS